MGVYKTLQYKDIVLPNIFFRKTCSEPVAGSTSLLCWLEQNPLTLGGSTLSGNLDLDGNSLILDADGDTSITADTDDQIDITIAGADDFQFTANTFTALSGSAIETDTINETTAATGVTIDTVLLKDGTVKTGAGAVGDVAVKINADNDGLYAVSGTQIGVAIDGSLVGGFDTNGIFTGTISEQVAAAGVTVDGVLLKDGGVSDPTETYFADFSPAAAQQALTGAGAITLTEEFTSWTSSATGDALTLANGTVIGQVKEILYAAETAGADTGVLTPTSLAGGTTITFNATGEIARLKWNGTAWVPVKLYSTTAGAAAPVLA